MFACLYAAVCIILTRINRKHITGNNHGSSTCILVTYYSSVLSYIVFRPKSSCRMYNQFGQYNINNVGRIIRSLFLNTAFCFNRSRVKNDPGSGYDQ